MAADIEVCSKCGKKKRRQGLTSFTQWIFDIESCACDRFAESVEEHFSKTKSFCAVCSLPISSGRAGSMTQWIFVAGSCSCATPVPQTVDSTNPETELRAHDRVEENEQELTISDDTLPTERYKVLKELGRGASGIVYLCRDRLLGKKVAVKTLRRLTNEQLIAFQAEARATSKLTHPAILTLLDFGPSASGAPYMVLEYFDGESLEKYLERNFVLPISQAISVFEDLADALSVAHSARIFHRDLKPSNVLIRLSDSGKPVVKLIDFGVARVKEETASSSEIQGMTLAGTPTYMSPDTFNGGVFDARSEVYSLGCLLFHCLAGKPPFQADTAIDLMRKHVDLPPPSLAEAYAQENLSSGPAFPQALELVISKCLRKNPDERYSSMNELKVAISNLSNLSGQETAIDGSLTTSQVHRMTGSIETSASLREPLLSLELFSPITTVAMLVVLIVMGWLAYTTYLGGASNTRSQVTVKHESGSSSRSQKDSARGSKFENGHSVSDLSERVLESKQLENLEQIGNNELALQDAANKGDINAAFELSEIYFKRGKTNSEDWKKSMYWVRKAADGGHSAALNDIGFLYEYGLGVKKDYSEAAKWYRKSADLKNYVAKNNLGMLYKKGAGVPRNTTLGIKLITEAARDDGNATAQFNLGEAYLRGEGVPRDYQKALFWLQASAAQGYSGSLSNLGFMYEKGLGVEQNFALAVKYYERAALQSNPTAINNLGHLYETGKGVKQDYQKSMEFYRQAASLGSSIALANIGNLYMNGQGVKKDQLEALRWFKKAVVFEEPLALNNLGCAYLEGRGVPVDYAKAMHFYRRAAAKNLAMAKHNIGCLYQSGSGVKRDYKEALKWFLEAAEDDCAISINRVGFFYKEGLGVKKDYKKAKDYFIMAAKRGEAQGFENLAALYENGYGEPVDLAKAIKFRQQAMLLGSPEAFNNMAILYEKGEGVPKSYEQAEKLYLKSAAMGCLVAKEQLRKLYSRGHGGRQLVRDPQQPEGRKQLFHTTEIIK